MITPRSAAPVSVEPFGTGTVGTNSTPPASATPRRATRLPGQPTFFEDRSRWGDLAAECRYRVGSLAARLGISPRQLERRVKREFACTPHQWLRELRMARAAELLRVDRPVKEIAGALGFPQASSFCRQFRTHYGMTSSEFAASFSARDRLPPW